MDVACIIATIKRTLVSDITIKLLLALSLIRILELILREKNILSAMMSQQKYCLKKEGPSSSQCQCSSECCHHWEALTLRA